MRVSRHYGRNNPFATGTSASGRGLEAPAKRVDSFAVADGRSVHARKLFGGQKDLLSMSTVMRIQLTYQISDYRQNIKATSAAAGQLDQRIRTCTRERKRLLALASWFITSFSTN